MSLASERDGFAKVTDAQRTASESTSFAEPHTMASTSAASGSAQMTLDQLVQRAQSASTSHNERKLPDTPHLGFARSLAGR